MASPVSFAAMPLPFRYAAEALATALSPSAYDRDLRVVAARQIYFSAWQALPGFTVACALLSWVVIRIVINAAIEYGIAQYALELTVRVLVIELIPLLAALFVAMRSGSAIAAEIALLHVRGERDEAAMVREAAPRFAGAVVAVTLFAALSAAIALFLTYLALYGASPWGLAQYVRITGQVFGPVIVGALALKTVLFGIAVAGVPVMAALGVPRESRAVPIAVLRAMVGLGLAIVAIEGVFLAVLYA